MMIVRHRIVEAPFAAKFLMPISIASQEHL
jgi:hypothetical protein